METKPLEVPVCCASISVEKDVVHKKGRKKEGRGCGGGKATKAQRMFPFILSILPIHLQVVREVSEGSGGKEKKKSWL